MVRTLIFFISFLPIASWATREYTFNLTEKDTNTRAVLEKSLPEETLVRHSLFTVKIPKGWTFQPMGPGEKFKASLTATPTEHLSSEETYFGIHVRQQNTGISLENRKLQIEKTGKTAKLVFWNNQKWLLTEFTEKDAAGNQAKNWVAFGGINGNEIVVTSATPESKTGQFSHLLIQIMESISLNKN
jgi:hypothetical protein